MTIQQICGVYYATHRNPKGGGWLAKGKTFNEALEKMLRLIYWDKYF